MAAETSLVKRYVESVLNATVERVEFRGRDVYVTRSGDTTALGALLSHLSDEERYKMGDELAAASVLDDPSPETPGYLCSDRFADEPLRLMTRDAPIPYARVVAYAAWFLSIVYDRPVGTFTRVAASSPPPFDRIDMDEVLAAQGRDAATSDVANRWMETMGKLIHTAKAKDVYRDGRVDAAECFRKHAETYREHASERVTSFARDLMDDDAKFLETVLEPAETLKLLFYLKDVVGLRTDGGIVHSMYAMNAVLGMLYDLGLNEDLIKCLECPVEAVRKLSLRLEARTLRSRAPYVFKPSELKRLGLFELHHLVKGGSWYDLCHALAKDPVEQTAERLDNVYRLFLRTDPNADTRPFYVVYLASILERGRMVASKTLTPKNNSEQRKSEIHYFSNMLRNFTEFVTSVTGRTAVDTPISQDHLVEFMRTHEADLYKMLEVVANDSLISACLNVH